MAGVDPTAVDPRRVLMTIAADSSAPATARVQACRFLLSGGEPAKPVEDIDPVTSLALQLLRGKS
jgi:hypothetical protein